MNGSLCQRLSIVLYTTAVTAATASSIDVTIKMQHVPRKDAFRRKNAIRNKRKRVTKYTLSRIYTISICALNQLINRKVGELLKIWENELYDT